MLIKTDVLTREADRMKYAIAAPLIYNIFSIKQCLHAARTTTSPVVIRVNTEIVDAKEAYDWVQKYLLSYPEVKVALVQENIKTYEEAVAACMMGYTGVALSDEILLNDSNMALIKSITRVCRGLNVSVEACVKDIATLVGGKGYQYVKDAKIDILKLMFDSISDDTIEHYANVIHTLRKETLVCLATDDISKIDEKHYLRLKESGISLCDVYDTLSANATNDVKTRYDNEVNKKKKLFMVELADQLAESYFESLIHTIREIGLFSKR